MAQAQTVQFPKRLPLAAEPENRDTSSAKDARLLNGYIERDKQGELWLFKRAGLSSSLALSGAGRGSYNWRGNLYEVFGTSLYKNGVSIGTVDGTNGVYRFSEGLGGTPRLTLGNGVKAYTYDGTTFAQITDPDFPAAFVKGWAYLDGTTYVMDSSANIYGSGLNDTTSWDPLNKIVAQIEPDGGVALAKQLVYVIAFKQWTGEVFYDAANSTGSPLGRVEGAKFNVGCLSADSVQSMDDVLFWLSTSRSAAPAIYKLENLKAQKVSTKPVDRLLDHIDFSSIYSWTHQEEGHSFYGLTSTVSNMTLVYDVHEDRWAQWTDASGNYWPIVSMTYAGTTSLVHYAQHATNGKRYLLDSDYTNDDGAVFPVDLYTPLFDGGVDVKKTVTALHLEGDLTPGSIVQVRWSDDDYKTWSGFKPVYMDRRRPVIRNMGTFYRRAHHLRHQSNTKLRIRAGDWQVDLGTA